MRALVLADTVDWADDAELLGLARQADCVFALGDLYERELRCLWDLDADVPRLGVYGNHCMGDYLLYLGFVNMHLRTQTVGGLLLGGFEGCLRYKDFGEYQYTQEQAAEMLAGFPRVDVLLAHSPPLGVHDADEPPHVGFSALREYCLREEPRLLLHGHTYPGTEETMLGRTRVVYVSGHKLVDLPS